MRKLLLGLALACCPLLPAYAIHPNSQDIQSLLNKHKIPANALALVALPLDGSSQGLSYNASQPVNPASTMKLVTTYAALELLGPNYSWRSDLLTDGRIQGDTLHGNLYFRSGGDPKITTERLWRLLQELKLLGINRVQGDLVLDGSHFDIRNLVPFDGEASDLYRPFMVEPDSLLINFGAQRFIARAANGKAMIQADPLIAQVQVDNQVQVVRGKPCSQAKVSFRPHRTATSLHMSVRGQLPEGCQQEAYFGFVDPARFASGAIRSTWAGMGGQLSGATRLGNTPSDSRLLASLPSLSVAETIRDINKFSNNTIAKQLFLTIGKRYRTPSDSDDVVAAQRTLGNWWRELGISRPSLVIENGSGLSRQERVTAEDLAHMLRHAARSPYAAEFMASLPVMGVDGTLRNRLKQHPVKGQARLKTGTLRNVRAIAGYSKDNQGRDWVLVAILYNGANINNSVLDSLVASLYSQQPPR